MDSVTDFDPEVGNVPFQPSVELPPEAIHCAAFAPSQLRLTLLPVAASAVSADRVADGRGTAAAVALLVYVTLALAIRPLQLIAYATTEA